MKKNIFGKSAPLGSLAMVASAIQEGFASLAFASNTTAGMIGFESISDTEFKNVEASAETARTYLEEAGLPALILKHSGADNIEHICVEKGMDAAVLTLLASQNPEAWQESYLGADTNKNVQVMGDAYGETEVSTEGYDPVHFDKYIGVSVIANALAAASSPFSEAFFRTIVLPSSQKGVDIKVTSPLVYAKKSRNRNGSAYDLEKKSVVSALVNSEILANTSTQIIPLVQTGANTNAAMLADDSVVANKTITIAGKELLTRPLAYGVDIDLMAISTHDTLLGAEAQDETDTLDTVIGLGTQYIKVTNSDPTTPVSAVIAVDTTNIRGSLFTNVAEGNLQDMTAYFESEVWVSSEDLSYAGAKLETALEIATLTGQTAGDAWKMKLNVTVTGRVKFTTANMIVNFGSAAVTEAFDKDAVAIDASDVAAIKAALTFEGAGFKPGATRSNSNMRNNGHIIDMTTSVTARIPAKMQSPLTILSPVTSSEGNGSMDGINMVKRVMSSNLAVKELFRFEAQLLATNGIAGGSPAIGAMAGITPTYIARDLDVDDKIVQLGSADSLNDLRGTLAAAVSVVTDQLLLDSGFLASLELFTGSTNNFEIVLGTDSRLGNLLMTSGDARLMGASYNFKTTVSHDQTMKNKIFISVRRTDTDEAEPHSFGVHAIMPSLMARSAVSRSGATSHETIVIPRESFNVVCPVLACINVLNMDKVFLTV